jgi:hypothetical protein
MLKFPQCLAFLDALVGDKTFRKHLTMGGGLFRDYVHKQQGLHWMHEARVQGKGERIVAAESPDGTASPSEGDAGDGDASIEHKGRARAEV